jgi:mRNA-degrading endonuclease YafQ of YafQ-DinJ toxin-antitoxin module
MPDYLTFVFTTEFVESFAAKEFSSAERRRFTQALRLLDTNERHPSLRVHELKGDMAGTWSASASDELRITFQRLPEGKKRLLECSRHYR